MSQANPFPEQPICECSLEFSLQFLIPPFISALAYNSNTAIETRESRAHLCVGFNGRDYLISGST